MVGGDVSKKAWTLFEEFKNFALKGNVIDLAVGVVIGASFTAIVNSLVKHILMPLISILTPGRQSYTGWKAELAGVEVPFGLFLGEVANFLIVALALYLFIVKFLGWVMQFKKATAAAAAPAVPPDVRLLEEIRDLLKARPV